MSHYPHLTLGMTSEGVVLSLDAVVSEQFETKMHVNAVVAAFLLIAGTIVTSEEVNGGVPNHFRSCQGLSCKR